MIHIRNLRMQYGEKVLFGGLSYMFPKSERIALIGINGAGKTTLLRVITGEIEVHGGEVHIPQHCRLGHLPQEPNPQPRETILLECMQGDKNLASLSEGMEAVLQKMSKTEQGQGDVSLAERYGELEMKYSAADGYSWESRSQSILVGLGFGHDQIAKQHPLELSGGWRMRLELAKLFLWQPDVLLLDEPTNHLDLPALVWVEQYLKAFSGTLIFVSHDRSLLNRLSTVTLELSASKLTAYTGAFDSYLEQKQAREEQQQAARANVQRQKKHLQDFVDRFGAKASKARQAQSRLKMIARLSHTESELASNQ